jgi:hypothetical protein
VAPRIDVIRAAGSEDRSPPRDQPEDVRWLLENVDQRIRSERLGRTRGAAEKLRNCDWVLHRANRAQPAATAGSLLTKALRLQGSLTTRRAGSDEECREARSHQGQGGRFG